MTDIVERLRKWRNTDHEDAITLHRNEIIYLLDRIRKLETRPALVDVPPVPKSIDPTGW